jgi:hypothetical protein
MIHHVANGDSRSHSTTRFILAQLVEIIGNIASIFRSMLLNIMFNWEAEETEMKWKCWKEPTEGVDGVERNMCVMWFECIQICLSSFFLCKQFCAFCCSLDDKIERGKWNKIVKFHMNFRWYILSSSESKSFNKVKLCRLLLCIVKLKSKSPHLTIHFDCREIDKVWVNESQISWEISINHR